MSFIPYQTYQDYQETEIRTSCEVFPGKTPEKAHYAAMGDIKMIKFRDVKNDGTIDYETDAEGWVDSRYADISALVDLPVGAILLTNAAHSSEHIGKKVAFVHPPPNPSVRHCFVGELTAIRSRSEELSTEWLFYYFQTTAFRHEVSKVIEGAHLIPRSFGKLSLRFPPRLVQEQHLAIVRLIEDCRVRLQAKLTAARRLKTALMQQLFTRGLPGRHTRFKETRIGEIPESWELLSLGKLTTVVSGIALNSDRAPKFNPHQYLTVIHVQRERLDLTEVRHLEVFPHELPDALMEEGDILVVEGHANALEIGRAAIATREVNGFAYQNHLFRVRLQPDAQLDRLFLLGVLNSERVRRHWNATCNTSSGLNTINHRGLRRLLIQCPSPKEQEEIATLLSNANEAIAACEAELRALDRLKRVLLQNLLTGRVRVR